MTGGYESGYAACSCFWGTEPGSLVRDLLALTKVAGLRVLDAGCGEGKNSIALAKEGATVNAMDSSALAIDHARRMSTNLSGIAYSLGDVRTANFSPESFDVVLAYGLLHCLSSEREVSDVLRRLQAATASDGFFVLCAFNDRYQELEAHPGFSPTTMKHDWYEEMFSDWTLLRCFDSDLTEVHPHNGIRHSHSMTRILARKG